MSSSPLISKRTGVRHVPRLRDHQQAPLAVVLTGTFMIVLDFFIVNVMLPAMRRELHATASGIEWVVASYGITFAAFLVTAGRLGDRYGRRRTFLAGVATFTASSLACGLAPSMSALIGARLLQGVGAALISPNVLSIIGVTYPGVARSRALRAYGLVMGLAAVGGQVIGGLLLQVNIAGLGWRSCFLINVPVGLAAFALAPHVVPESRSDQPSRLDLIGMGLITAALAAIVLPLIDGRQQGWPAWSWLLGASAPALLGAFVACERRAIRHQRTPLLDLRMFHVRAFSAGLVTQFAFWCQQAAFFLVLALYLQVGRGMSALHAGLVFAILAAAYLAVSLRAPVLTIRYGRDLVAVGGALLVGGYATLLTAVAIAATHASVLALAPGLVLLGAGEGLCITPLTATVMGNLEPGQAGAAAGLLSTMQQVGNSVGVAVTGVVFFSLLGHGYASALQFSAAELGAVGVMVVALTRVMPRAQARGPGKNLARRRGRYAKAQASESGV